MIVKDNIKRTLFVVFAVVLPLTIVLNLLLPGYGIEPRDNKALLWASIIIRFLTAPALVFWLLLFFYKDWLRNRIDTIKRAARWRIVVSLSFWLTIVLLVLVGMRFFIDVYRGSDRFVFALIIPMLLMGYSLLYFWKEWQYCRKKPLCNILAASFVEQHNKFLHSHDFDKSYAALVKACETAPDEPKLWCILASFCETFCNKTAEADKYMATAEELLTKKKAGSNSDKACYLNYLGSILYERGECDKGLEYMKQSIDIEPTPGRISLYEKKLAESRDKRRET
jgi:tetratricopeptide (TPR) repeat protein